MRSKIPSSLVLLAVVALLAVAAVPASASHSWNGYHWGRTANPVTIEFGDNTTNGEWSALLAEAAADWSESRVLDAVVAEGRTTDPQACRPTLGRVEVCNGVYGENQKWVGIAQIWIYADGHIAQGTVRNNDSYLNNPDKQPERSTEAYRRYVMCQEVGHTFGLDHQDEDRTNENLGTCMDYTRDPDGSIEGQPSNEHPNRHDYQELSATYKHLDDVDTAGATGAALGGSFTPSEPRRSGVSRYETRLAGGGRLVTWVIWAP